MSILSDAYDKFMRERKNAGIEVNYFVISYDRAGQITDEAREIVINFILDIRAIPYRCPVASTIFFVSGHSRNDILGFAKDHSSFNTLHSIIIKFDEETNQNLFGNENDSLNARFVGEVEQIMTKRSKQS